LCFVVGVVMLSCAAHAEPGPGAEAAGVVALSSFAEAAVAGDIKFDTEETPVCELELFGREDTAKDMMEPEDDAEEDDGRSGEDDIDDQLQALGDDIGSLVQSQSQLSGEACGLLEKGADVDKDGNTPLMIVASKGKISKVKKELAKGVEVNAQNNDGDTALLIAVKGTGKERLDVVNELLATEGVDVNIKNNNHDTALMLATRQGFDDNIVNNNHDIVKALLATEGVDVNIVNDNHDTALLIAAREGRPDGFNWRDLGPRGQLPVRSYSGLLSIVTQLLAKGAKVNAQNKVGTTALMYATYAQNKAGTTGWDRIVKVLLGNSADTELINGNGMTALGMVTGRKTTWTTLELLLEAKLDSIEERVNQLENVGD